MRKAFATGVAAIALTGCAIGATLRSYDLAPNGIERSEERLRRALSFARPDSAPVSIARDLPDDALLKALYEGVFAYYGGRFRTSATRLGAAAELTDARFTKSVSQNALALLVNDRSLDYQPGTNEILLTHYYAALAYLAANDLEGATVEARRLGYLLERDRGEMDAREKDTRAMLRWFAGAIFEAAGERNDALVAYRNARVLQGVPADTAGEHLATDRVQGDSGDVLVIVEQGYVAFPTPFSLTVPIYKHEWGYLGASDRSRQGWMAASVGNRLVAQLATMPDEGLYYGAPALTLAEDEQRWGAMSAPHDGQELTIVANNRRAYRYPGQWGSGPLYLGVPEQIIKLSVPVYRRARPAPRVSIDAGGVSAARPFITASISDAELADFKRERAWIYTRAVLRTAIKAIAAKEAKDAAERSAAKDAKTDNDKKRAERWGELFGFLTSAAGAILERADTRNWNLLPNAVSLVRVRLPAGKQTLVLNAGATTAPIELRDVVVRPGQLTFATRRVWGSERDW